MMISKKLIFMGMLLLVIMGLTGCLSDDENTVEGLTVKDVFDDIERGDNSTFFKSFDPGDKIIIRDTITNISLVTENNEILTFAYFESGSSLPFEKNVSQEFHDGDEVFITLHVIETELMGYKMEFFREMWDGQNYALIPRSSITHA